MTHSAHLPAPRRDAPTAADIAIGASLFLGELDAWAQRTPRTPGSAVSEASARIASCFLQNAPTLDLTGVPLTSLPDCVGQMRLQELRLDGQHWKAFAALPAMPPSCEINIEGRRMTPDAFNQRDPQADFASQPPVPRAGSRPPVPRWILKTAAGASSRQRAAPGADAPALRASRARRAAPDAHPLPGSFAEHSPPPLPRHADATQQGSGGRQAMHALKQHGGWRDKLGDALRRSIGAVRRSGKKRADTSAGAPAAERASAPGTGAGKGVIIPPRRDSISSRSGDGHFRFHDVDGPNGFFSNAWTGKPVRIDGQPWPTIEHYYQAMKFPAGSVMRSAVQGATTPDKAKRMARGAAPPGWRSRRAALMYEAVHAKFSQNRTLRQKLLDTGNAILVEEVPEERSDRFRGATNGIGGNALGQILMLVREDLRAERGPQTAGLDKRLDTDPRRNWNEIKAQPKRSIFRAADTRARAHQPAVSSPLAR